MVERARTDDKNFTSSEIVSSLESKLPNADEKLMAAISHAGIIIGGILVALIVWLVQKDKSKYVDFQAKQALVYQLVVLVGESILGVVGFVLGVLTFGIGFFILVPVLIIIGLGTLVYGLYAAYKTYLGEDFRYWVIADMLEKKT